MNAIGVADLAKALAAPGGCQAIDVREPGEYESEHIAGTRLVPLSSFASAVATLDPTQPVYVICRSGQRAQQARRSLVARGFPEVQVVDGGMLAWRAAGLPLVVGERRVWALDRQVRFVAGTLVLLGLSMAAMLHPAWLALTGFVGAGLVFSGVTDICAMALLLAHAPWNRSRTPRSGVAACDARPQSSLS